MHVRFRIATRRASCLLQPLTNRVAVTVDLSACRAARACGRQLHFYLKNMVVGMRCRAALAKRRQVLPQGVFRQQTRGQRRENPVVAAQS